MERARESRRVSDILIPPYETTCNIPYHATPHARAPAPPGICVTRCAAVALWSNRAGTAEKTVSSYGGALCSLLSNTVYNATKWFIIARNFYLFNFDIP